MLCTYFWPTRLLLTLTKIARHQVTFYSNHFYFELKMWQCFVTSFLGNLYHYGALLESRNKKMKQLQLVRYTLSGHNNTEHSVCERNSSQYGPLH